MVLNSPRLTFKEINRDALQQVHALHSLPETDRFNTLGLPGSITVTENIVNRWLEAASVNPREQYVFTVLQKDTGLFTGVCGIKMGKINYRSAELWYKLHPEFWNKGYATEAVKTLLDFCFSDLGLHRVEAGCAVENLASVKVLEKSGFTREGRKRKILPIRGEWVDNYFYAILKEDLNSD